MIWSMSSGGKVMSAAFCCCSEDMFVGRIDLTGYSYGLEDNDNNERGSVLSITYMPTESRCCGGVQYHDGVGPFYHVP
jgi:hypothetical protein